MDNDRIWQDKSGPVIMGGDPRKPARLPWWVTFGGVDHGPYYTRRDALSTLSLLRSDHELADVAGVK